jgi:hypothetical protein
MLPTVVSSWLDVEWWTILDTHGKLLSVKSPAVLQFLTQTGALDTTLFVLHIQLVSLCHGKSFVHSVYVISVVILHSDRYRMESEREKEMEKEGARPSSPLSVLCSV